MALPGPFKTLRLELACGSDPIRGTIGPPDGPTVAFTGWMELAAALEAAHTAREVEPRGQPPGARPIRKSDHCVTMSDTVPLGGRPTENETWPASSVPPGPTSSKS